MRPLDRWDWLFLAMIVTGALGGVLVTLWTILPVL